MPGFQKRMIYLFHQSVALYVFEQKRKKFSELVVGRFIFLDILPYLLRFFLVVLNSSHRFFRYLVRIFSDLSSGVDIV